MQDKVKKEETKAYGGVKWYKEEAIKMIAGIDDGERIKMIYGFVKTLHK